MMRIELIYAPRERIGEVDGGIGCCSSMLADK
jgi:hypothetical protein